MEPVKSFKNENLKNKVALLRTDYNVPTNGKMILDTTRIDESIPTIKALLDKEAKIIILTHRGRPKGKIDISLSMEPVARELEKRVTTPVRLINNLDEDVRNYDEKIFLFENLRFYPNEEANDQDFAHKLSKLGDVYINDAFAASHRAHASLSSIPKFIPSYFGTCMTKEIEALKSIFENPKRPVMAVIGGSKVSTKIQLLKNLILKVDSIIIGGAMANTFLKVRGNSIGASLYEESCLQIANEIINLAEQNNVNLIFPTDAKVSKTLQDDPNAINKNLDQIDPDDMILDLGIESSKIIGDLLADAKTVIWNGPLGAIEFKPFEEATVYVAKILAKMCLENNTSVVVGGGDTIYGINIADTYNSYTHVSTGGGAFLEWLEGKELPGVRAVIDNKEGG